MSRRFHGLTSLGLVGVALALAAIAMFQASWGLGGLYLVVCVVAPGVILYTYCAKCPCKGRCAHVLLGWGAGFFEREPGPYSRVEMAALALALLALLGTPQPWLWRQAGLFAAFWILNAVALLQIRRYVCRACENVYCPLKAGG